MVHIVETRCHTNAAVELFSDWLRTRLPESAYQWLIDKRKAISEPESNRVLFTAFSSIPRYLGKADLALTSDELDAASCCIPGWRPSHWSIDQAGRTFLLLAVPSESLQGYQNAVNPLFEAADLGEQVALFQALPLLPHPEFYRLRAIDGLRTNMTAVFDAIALRNPYPADHFDENAWNQLVLKSLFVGSPLHLIVGLDRRANPTLARMLSDYAHERWAAGRLVSPELWRCVGPFAVGELAADLTKAIAQPDALQQQAAALACAQSADPEAQALLVQKPELHAQIISGDLTWTTLSHRLASAS